MNLQRSIEIAKKARLTKIARQHDNIVTVKKGGEIENGQSHSPAYRESNKVDLKPNMVPSCNRLNLLSEQINPEPYKILRTKILQATRDKNWRTILFTSISPGEGKTLTSINLSISLSREFNQTVLLVDCDFKKQNIHKYLGYNHKKGIADYINNDIELKEVIAWPGIEKLTVISGGDTVEDSSEILGSPKMRQLIEEMKARYDDRYIIFDTAPILSSADTISLIPSVDCVVMVVKADSTSIKEIAKAQQLIPKEKLLGFVLNRQRSPFKKYESYY